MPEPKNVMIFIRPQESPALTKEDKDIRVEYGNHWILFRNGRITIKSEEE